MNIPMNQPQHRMYQHYQHPQQAYYQHAQIGRPPYHLGQSTQVQQQQQPPPPAPQAQPPLHQHQTNMNYSLSHAFQKLAYANEQAWLHIGKLAETIGDSDRALHAYESALRHNPYSAPALTQIAAQYRSREQFQKAIEILQRLLNVDQGNGETWGALGHSYLMLDDIPKAFGAYQQALQFTPQEARIWFGLGVLYDRTGQWENAEEALSKVLKFDPKFDKANEVYFRLGLLHRMTGKYEQSLQCFKYILSFPPRPLAEIDVLFQIGCVHELQKDFSAAKDVYEKVLKEIPTDVKVLQQLGWLYKQQGDFDTGIQYLEKAKAAADEKDHRTHYLLGRIYMAQKNFNKAYDAYQQAIYRENRNPMYWCSIGVLYFEISQQRDALDAFTRAIRQNPYLFEVWYDLGALYESCNNQVQDAIDAYTKALELDPSNSELQERISKLNRLKSQGGTTSPSPIHKALEIDPNHPRFNPYNYNLPPHPAIYAVSKANVSPQPSQANANAPNRVQTQNIPQPTYNPSAGQAGTTDGQKKSPLQPMLEHSGGASNVGATHSLPPPPVTSIAPQSNKRGGESPDKASTQEPKKIKHTGHELEGSTHVPRTKVGPISEPREAEDKQEVNQENPGDSAVSENGEIDEYTAPEDEDDSEYVE